MLNKINPTYVFVALVVAVLITMLVGLLPERLEHFLG